MSSSAQMCWSPRQQAQHRVRRRRVRARLRKFHEGPVPHLHPSAESDCRPPHRHGLRVPAGTSADWSARPTALRRSGRPSRSASTARGRRAPDRLRADRRRSPVLPVSPHAGPNDHGEPLPSDLGRCFPNQPNPNRPAPQNRRKENRRMEDHLCADHWFADHLFAGHWAPRSRKAVPRSRLPHGLPRGSPANPRGPSSRTAREVLGGRPGPIRGC